uniref:Uncharacterized protein n=1 Tax=Oryzias latipes TaxID=8090 RepID=A0A3B3HBK2_ORYLA
MSLTSITFTFICSDPDLEGLPPSTAVRTREITDCFSRSKAVFNTSSILLCIKSTVSCDIVWCFMTLYSRIDSPKSALA